METANEISKLDIDSEKFRLFLQSEFDRRKEKNSRYSLRSFSSHLDIHVSCLSAILRGIRPLTDNLISRFLNKLELNPEELEKLLKTENLIENIQAILTLDTFAIISQWYHYAILELPKTEDFKEDFVWISKVLEISVTEVQSAVERLCRVGLLEIQEDGKWHIVEEETQVSVNEFTTSALKKLQKSILRKSEEAIDSVDISHRFHSTYTMAMEPDRIPEAKEYLREFKDKFSIKMSENKKTKEVYQFHIGLFPLTKINKETRG